MRRLPIIPTLIVAAAVAAMIALGLWQLQRAQWKAAMLEELARAPVLPPLDLDRIIERAAADQPIAFRRAAVTCTVRGARAELRAGRSRSGQSGYSYFIPCRPGAGGLAARLRINAGWSQRPNSDLRLTPAGIVAGTIGTAEAGAPVILTADTAIGPLEPSARPRIEDIPNNHLAYAGQWFFFALAAAIIYGLALRRRATSHPSPPKSSA